MLVVAAHPDDLECCCGGLISLLTARGVQVFSVNCTLGDIGAQEGDVLRPALATTRLRETEDAARVLGLAATFNLGHHDGELVPDLELRAQLARLYRITQADSLFTFDPHWPGQIHPDHRAAGQAALDAYMPAKMPLYRPEQLREPGAALSQLKRIFLFSTEREPEILWMSRASIPPSWRRAWRTSASSRAAKRAWAGSRRWTRELGRGLG